MESQYAGGLTVQMSHVIVVAIGQLIPWISSLTYVTTAIPLGAVLGLTAVKDIYDDVVSLLRYVTWLHLPVLPVAHAHLCTYCSLRPLHAFVTSRHLSTAIRVSLCFCLSFRSRISKTTHQNFVNFLYMLHSPPPKAMQCVEYFSFCGLRYDFTY